VSGAGVPAARDPARGLVVVVAPDSFKGSLTSVEVARALARGWKRARPKDDIRLAPLADGGEGTLVAIEAAGGWEWRSAIAHDPLGREITARWLQSEDGRRAVVELAAASGLSRLAAGERDPVAASTFGTGEVLRAVLDAGVRRIDLGVGGSATTDGGLGILAALGLGRTLEPDLVVDLDAMDPRLAEVDLRIASDVTNPLLGAAGAAAVYGPQKGAGALDVRNLDAALERWADALESATGRRERDTPGAGAAGGTVFGLACLRDRFRSFSIVPGVDLVMEATGFAGKLAGADLVITGEGRIDGQTAFGKTALGVARRAAAAGVPCIAVGGGVELEGIEALATLGTLVVPVVERPQSVEEAMAAGPLPLERCGERLAHLVGLGMGLTKSED
jgi:glycerate kinase